MYMILALFGINILALVAVLYVLLKREEPLLLAPTPAPIPTPPEEDILLRKRIEAENEAFQRLMSYSPAMAYGIAEEGGEDL